MSKSEKPDNSSSRERNSLYGDFVFHGHIGGGKLTEPPEMTPNIDTSAIPPLRDSGKEAVVTVIVSLTSAVPPSRDDNSVHKDYNKHGYQPSGSGKVKKPPTNTPNQGSSGKKG